MNQQPTPIEALAPMAGKVENTEAFRKAGLLRRAAIGIAGVVLASTAMNVDTDPAQAADHHETPSYRGETTSESFRIGTFNILGAFHRGNIDARARVASEIIMGKRGDAGRTSIVGLQEVSKEQKPLFDKYLDGYQSVPKKTHNKENSRVYIYYETARFELLNDGIIRHPFYGDKGLHRGGEAVWGKFMDKVTGKVFYDIASHSSAWNTDPGSDAGAAEKRRETARIIDAFIDKKERSEPEEVDVFKVGDGNATIHRRLKPGWRSPRPNKDRAITVKELPYYIYTEKDAPGIFNLQDSLDVLQNRRGHGVDKRHTWVRDNTVDFVYVPGSGWTVSDWDKVQNDFASDHYLVTAEVSPIETSPTS